MAISPIHNFKALNPTQTHLTQSVVSFNLSRKIGEVLKNDSHIYISNLTIPSQLKEADLANRTNLIDLNSSHEELGALLNEERQKIEEALEDYKKHKGAMGKHDAQLGIKKFGIGIVKAVNENVEDGLSFLELVLPPEILDDEKFKEYFEKVELGTEICSNLIKTLELGLHGSALIYKSKILFKAKKILEEIKKNYAEQNLELPQEIREWELSIHSKLEDLSEQYAKFGLKTIKSSSSISKFLIKFFSLIKNPEVKKITTSVLSNLKLGVGLILSILSYKDSSSDAKFLNEKIKQYQDWKHKHSHIEIPKISQNEPNQPLKRELKKIEANDELLKDILKGGTSFESLKTNLRLKGITLPGAIKSKKQFLDLLSHSPQFKDKIIQQIRKHTESMQELDEIIKAPLNLLQKREAILEKNLITFKTRADFSEVLPKVFEFKKNQLFNRIKNIITEATLYNLPISHVSERLKKEVGLEIPKDIKQLDDISKLLIADNKPGVFIDQWFSKKSFNTDSLIKDYIDHHEVLEKTTISSLKELIKTKFNLEKKFSSFNLLSSKTQLALAITAFVVSTILLVMLFFPIPFVNAPLLLLISTIAATVLNYGLTGTGLVMSYKYRTSHFNIKNRFKMVVQPFSKLMASLYQYKSISKKQYLNSKASLVKELQNSNDPVKKKKAYAQWEKAKGEFESNEKKIAKWGLRAKEMEADLVQHGWKDFANYANLKVNKKQIQTQKDKDEQDINFDTLQSFKSGFENMDFSLLDLETQMLLQNYLGLDLKSGQKVLKEKPDIIHSLKNFFYLTDEKLLKFLKNQDKKANAGIIPKMS